jgi:hypothetical protein
LIPADAHGHIAGRARENEGRRMDHQIVIGLGFAAGALYIASHYMKTMVPLRLCEIGANVLFVGYGWLYPSYPTLALYAILICLNSLRLYEMLELIKKVRDASSGDLSIEWLKPFMYKHTFEKGNVLFHKGDPADEMYYIVSGRCHIKEINIEIKPGALVGELGFLTPERIRTQTIECLDEVHVLTITYEKLTELYFQNPSFGLFFLKLTSQRLLQNVARLERSLAERAATA